MLLDTQYCLVFPSGVQNKNVWQQRKESPAVGCHPVITRLKRCWWCIHEKSEAFPTRELAAYCCSCVTLKTFWSPHVALAHLADRSPNYLHRGDVCLEVVLILQKLLQRGLIVINSRKFYRLRFNGNGTHAWQTLIFVYVYRFVLRVFVLRFCEINKVDLINNYIIWYLFLLMYLITKNL